MTPTPFLRRHRRLWHLLQLLDKLLRRSRLMMAGAATLLCATACITEGNDAEDIVGVGDVLPHFSVTTLDGATVTDATLRGTPALIVFFSTRCSDCQRELPVIDAYYRTARERGVQVLCIGREESADDVARYWQQAGLSLPVAPQTDRNVFALFATSGIPRVYAVGSDGRITHVWVERIDEGALP